MCEFCVLSICAGKSSKYFLKDTKKLPLDRARESSSWGRSRFSFPITRLPSTLQEHVTLHNKDLLFESLPHPFNKNWRPYSNKPRHHGCESCGKERAIWVKKALKESRRSLRSEATRYFDDAYDRFVDDAFDDDDEIICE